MHEPAFPCFVVRGTKRHYRALFKQKVITAVNETGNNLATARHFSVLVLSRRPGNASRWAACSGLRKAFTVPQYGCHVELEEDLAQYMNTVRNSCIAVTVKMIPMKPSELAREHGLASQFSKQAKAG